MDRTYRALLAVVAAAAPLLLVAGVAATPHDGDQHVTNAQNAASELAAAGAHQTGLLLGSTMVIFGLGLLGVAFGTIGVLVRGRGSRWALAAVLLGGLGGFGAAILNVLVGLVPVAEVRSSMSDDARASLLVSVQGGHIGGPFALSYFGGLILGALCAGVALWRSGVVPRWFAALFPVGFAVAMVAESGAQALLVVPWGLMWLWLARGLVTTAAPLPTPAAAPLAPAFG
jgi:hypothetical protein